MRKQGPSPIYKLKIGEDLFFSGHTPYSSINWTIHVKLTDTLDVLLNSGFSHPYQFEKVYYKVRPWDLIESIMKMKSLINIATAKRYGLWKEATVKKW